MTGSLSCGGIAVLLASAPFRTFPEFIAPFLPAMAGFAVALGIEYSMRWSGYTSRFNSWFSIACAVFLVFLFIWDAWSRGTQLPILIESPDREGLTLRLALLGFGLAAFLIPLLATLAGVRQVLQEWALCGTPLTILRLLPAPVVPYVLVRQVPQIVQYFESTVFRLFH